MFLTHLHPSPMEITAICKGIILPYYIQDMSPLLTNRPISKEKEFEIDLINKEVSDFLKKKENILFVSSLNNNV